MKIKDILNNSLNNEKKLALGQVLNLSNPEMLLNKDKKLTTQEYKKYKKIEKKIDKGIPIQYILKKANFYGIDFYVDKNVLIPRPETEILVERTQNLIKKYINTNNKQINILDIGTGSGAIAITLKVLNSNYNITATDISSKAIKIAKKNSKKNKTDIKFIKTNLYQGINEKYDLIISNPPYIDKNSTDIEEKVKNNEPSIALFAENQGLYYYEKIIKNISTILKKEHIIAFEIGESQSRKIQELAGKYLPNDRVIIDKDYNGFDRYVFIIGGFKDEKFNNIRKQL